MDYGIEEIEDRTLVDVLAEIHDRRLRGYDALWDRQWREINDDSAAGSEEEGGGGGPGGGGGGGRVGDRRVRGRSKTTRRKII